MTYFQSILGKLLVTTGYYWHNGVHSEVIDLQNPNVTCNDFPDFPIEMDDSFGGLFETKFQVQGNMFAAICGGQSSDIDNQSKCYIYYPSRQEWTEAEEKLLQPRSTFGSILINDRNNDIILIFEFFGDISDVGTAIIKTNRINIFPMSLIILV